MTRHPVTRRGRPLAALVLAAAIAALPVGAAARCEAPDVAEYDATAQDWAEVVADAAGADPAFDAFCAAAAGTRDRRTRALVCDPAALLRLARRYAVRDGTDPVLGARWRLDEPCHGCRAFAEWTLEWLPSRNTGAWDGWLLLERRRCWWD